MKACRVARAHTNSKSQISMPSFSSSSYSSSSNPQPPPQTNPDADSDSDSEPEQELIPSLPYEVALNCLARVSRCHHPTLCLVSKPIRSLVSSPLFFNTRSLLHATQPVLYLFLSIYNDSSHTKWFALPLNPHATNLPLPLPLPLPPIAYRTFDPSYALLGHDIYVIGGGAYDRTPSPRVCVLDCRFNRWRQGPTMLVPREHPAATVLDGKIYVIGGCELGSSIWAEVLEPAVGNWEKVASPSYVPTSVRTCEAVDGRIYVVTEAGELVYDPRSGVWESLKTKALCLEGRTKKRACLVDGVLYALDDRFNGIIGLEVREAREGGVPEWKEVKGLHKALPGYRRWQPNLARAGRKLILVWTREGVPREQSEVSAGPGGKLRVVLTYEPAYEIWCSQVEVHKNNEDGELWATLGWSQMILSFPQIYSARRCLAVDM